MIVLPKMLRFYERSTPVKFCEKKYMIMLGFLNRSVLSKHIGLGGRCITRSVKSGGFLAFLKG